MRAGEPYLEYRFTSKYHITTQSGQTLEITICQNVVGTSCGCLEMQTRSLSGCARGSRTAIRAPSAPAASGPSRLRWLRAGRRSEVLVDDRGLRKP